MSSSVIFSGWSTTGPTAFTPDDGSSILGVDIGSLPDLDAGFALVSGYRALGEALVRRYETPRGALFYDDDYGYDLRGRLNDSLTATDVASIGSEMAAEAEKEERVLSATWDCEFNAQTGQLSATGTIETATGPFTLVLTADKLTLQLLQIQ